ncbi:pyridoxamine 5'-phosphate oxidase family protein [Paenibacillus crassostreae]|uniref:Pyridoxamine 5'-phosphate oxidase n=1 Tax=Paenibacillus crassostreae TaxID=1763538 RepID=A0A167BVI0_9BACL|nr:pyridoxamine 5'-phosphate oxidase family protein [Paenibacillus crassostreae]AOZ92541.1 pyridoxamine 5'-phosphate oxidase [Paenibacillus crassostreae]OAB72489.1 pyridoxamine 5'-phosphate oxidase [Paenibacillus crassostreae]
MGKNFQAILPEHELFIKQQQMFFVGTAADHGHVNISPKGHDVFRILSPNKVAYLDLTGSGNETSAHLSVNNRMTYMFISFEGNPLILRLYGDGTVILPGTQEWEETAQHFNILPGARQIIISNIEIVKTSCGFSVPLYSFAGERNLLLEWADKKGEEGLEEYKKKKNSTSMDGIVTPIGHQYD